MLHRLACLLALCTVAWAQDFRGTIVGRVTDSTGASVATARVTATNVETGAVTTTQTSESGDYTLPGLAPGRYSLTVELAGFKKFVREAFTIEVQARPQIDVQLEPGDVQSSVSVSGEAPLLETATASRGGVITGRTLVDLPLNGRNAFALAGLEPGVNFTARGQANGTSLLRTTGNGGFSSFTFNGGQFRSNESLLDGIPNAGTDGQVQYVPSVDAASEFKVQTNSYDAEYGRFTGGVFNAAIRSGTNQFHGTLFNFTRNSVWNARDPFAATIPQFGYNLFGGSAGGPVLLPKVYDGRNKTFWFFNYEGSREGVPRANVATVPTALERAGDYSATRVRSGANVLPVNVYNPYSTRASGTAFVRDPFPNNTIPASLISPIARRVAAFWPDANAAGDAVTNANNFQLSFKDPVFDNGYVMKFDHRFSDRHAVFFRYSWREFGVDRQGTFKNAVSGDIDRRKAPGLAFDDTFTLNPSTVINFRYGLARFTTFQQSDNLGFDMTGLGFPAGFTGQLPVQAIPSFTFGNGIAGLSTANKLSRGAEDVHTFRASVSKAISRHTIKTGAEYRILNSNVGSVGANAAGAFAFDQAFTRGPNPQVAGVNLGHSMASFLLGLPASGSTANNAATADRTNYYGFFVHDDWRVSNRLTLNLGLRYEWEGAYVERYNRMNRGYDLTTASPIAAAARAAYAQAPIPEIAPANFNVTGGLLFAGVGGVPRALSDIDRNNVAPRIGAAFQLNSKTVIRGGYGIFYGASTQTGEARNGFSVSTAYVASNDGGNTPANSLTNPFPQGLLAPAGASLGLLTQVGQGIAFTSTDRRQPFAHQYSFGIQRQLPWNTLFDLSYAGSQVRDLPVNQQIAPIPEQFRASAEQTFFSSGRNPLNDAVTNPFFGIITSGPLAARTVTRGQLLRPYPHFTSIEAQAVPRGSSRYDALQIKATRRFAEGFSMTAAYSFTKQLERTRFLNQQDTELTKELNEFDIPQRFVVSSAYELPFGPGKKFLSGANGFTRRLVEGMQLNVLYVAQSGIPLTITGAESTGVSAKLGSGEETVQRWFNTSAFRQRQAVELVRTSRLPDVRSAGKNNFDISFFKTTTIAESVKLQFRAEAFNALNRAEYSSPGTVFGTAQFGVVTSTNTFNRQLQLALKLLW
ncbi:MAG: TonB-dependent receptor [Bryobacteraceae bacterium]|nr:TonB-dependent receptor [Bryobacteraceae bacterium]